jgi:hypothetical protein
MVKKRVSYCRRKERNKVSKNLYFLIFQRTLFSNFDEGKYSGLTAVR